MSAGINVADDGVSRNAFTDQNKKNSNAVFGRRNPQIAEQRRLKRLTTGGPRVRHSWVSETGAGRSDPTSCSTNRGCGDSLVGPRAKMDRPNDPQFPTDWANASRAIGDCRAIFVASRGPLDNPLLQESIPMTQAFAP